MLPRKTNTFQTIDRLVVFLYLALVTIGWFSIYAATHDYDQKSIFDFSGRAGMQLIWILTSFLIAAALLLIESDWYEVIAPWIYLIAITLLVVTIFIAPDIKGSRSWLVLGPLRIQPAEFAKFATALLLAKLLGNHQFEIKKKRNLLLTLTLIALPMTLILLQKETGSALIFLLFIPVLYREGMSGTILLAGSTAALLFVTALRYASVTWGTTPAGEFLGLALILLLTLGRIQGQPRTRPPIRYLFYTLAGINTLAAIITLLLGVNWVWVLLLQLALVLSYTLLLSILYRSIAHLQIILFTLASTGFLYSVDYVFENLLEPHQKNRIQVALGTIDDPSGAGYNVTQSKIAVGSGGLLGKGYTRGTQTKLHYVPEQDTDFIFSTIGEERGFLGSLLVILLFLALILRIILLVERQRSPFRRVYGYAVALLLFGHFLINIGMVIGITPVIGIPLPFISYGGSSLWTFTLLLFVFLRLNAGTRFKN
jgi:rod shape determining protein RodA